jgi:hypothetical protein
MTTGTEATSGTAELAPVAPGALALATGRKSFTVAKLLDLLAQEPLALVPGDAEPFPAVAPEVTITPELTAGLRALPGLFGTVQVTERRLLTADEIRQLTDEIIAINSVSDALGKRKEAIGVTIRHHADVRAEQAGAALAKSQTRGGVVLRPATPRIQAGKAAGHYELATEGSPVEIVVPGYQDPWTIRRTKGKSEMSLGTLEELRDKGDVTQAEYNAFTRQMRVLDEDKIKAFVRANPGRALQILAAITTTEPAGASTYSPKK